MGTFITRFKGMGAVFIYEAVLITRKFQQTLIAKRKTANPTFTSISLLLLTLLFTGCKTDFAHVDKESELQPLSRLMDGNKRFYTHNPKHPNDNEARIKEISRKQNPFAVVVCCSDSRVSPELVFDQGLGDLFVIRTAGNVIGNLELGSIEYAVEHLGVKLVIIMGHERCGAIQAYLDHNEVDGHIKSIIDSIANEYEVKTVASAGVHVSEAFIRANVSHAIAQLVRQSKVLREKQEHAELQIVGSVYGMDEGKVSFIGR